MQAWSLETKHSSAPASVHPREAEGGSLSLVGRPEVVLRCTKYWGPRGRVTKSLYQGMSPSCHHPRIIPVPVALGLLQGQHLSTLLRGVNTNVSPAGDLKAGPRAARGV